MNGFQCGFITHDFRLGPDLIIVIISFWNFRKEQGTLRQMSSEKLIKTLPTLQNQVDALLDFDVTTNGQAHHMFLRFLNLRFFSRNFLCFLLVLQGKGFRMGIKIGKEMTTQIEQGCRKGCAIPPPSHFWTMRYLCV